MRKTALVFGAGQIGRGFIGDICRDAGYELVFADINERLTTMLDDAGRYPLWILQDGRREKTIDAVRAVPLSDADRIVGLLADVELAFTAVGALNVAGLGPLLARGIEAKMRRDPSSRLNVVICENLLHSARTLEAAVLAHLPPACESFFRERVGLVETVVSRMVAPLSPELRATHPLLVTVENYNILPVSAPAFKGPVPEIPAFRPAANLFPYEELKLFGHNLLHAALAYLGARRGLRYVWESLADPSVRPVFDAVADEARAALARKHGFPPGEVEEYVAGLTARFANRLLGDTVARVGRDPMRKLGPNDRLVGAIELCLSQGVFPRAVCLVTAACLCYTDANDPESLKLQSLLRERGVDHVLSHVCRLPDNEARALVKQHYEEFSHESSPAQER